MLPDQGPYVLLDDARAGGATYLFQNPDEIIVAHETSDVGEALERVRAAVARGAYAAGYLSFEAGLAFQQRRPVPAPKGGGPLLWFGTFGDVVRISPAWPTLDHSPAPALSTAWAYPDYRRALHRVLNYVKAGDVYQINLTFPLLWEEKADPIACYSRWRHAQQAGWGAVVSMPDRWLLSASPELFFSAEEGRLWAKPMKGTARRAPGRIEDDRLAKALSKSVKDRAENLMIVDLLRNDLSRVSLPGSVCVPSLFEVETYPTIHQMTSTVTARLRPGLDVIDVIQAIFPCGSITGAPKLRAMEIIDEIEGRPRGPYTGSIGYLAPGGDGAFNVAIRTVEFDTGSARASMGVGSAIVADSLADDEWSECLAKAIFLGGAFSA